MIVDDALFMRNILKDIFEQAGYEVVAEADNGEEVLPLYHKAAPDLVTMDIIMPRRSGLDALRDLMAADPAARVIMVSALSAPLARRPWSSKRSRPVPAILSSSPSRKPRFSKSPAG